MPQQPTRARKVPEKLRPLRHHAQHQSRQLQRLQRSRHTRLCQKQVRKDKSGGPLSTVFLCRRHHLLQYYQKIAQLKKPRHPPRRSPALCSRRLLRLLRHAVQERVPAALATARPRPEQRLSRMTALGMIRRVLLLGLRRGTCRCASPGVAGYGAGVYVTVRCTSSSDVFVVGYRATHQRW